MAVSISVIDPYLKEFTEGIIRDQLNQEVLAKQYIEETDRQWAGRHIRFPLHTRRNTGVGARAESAALPSAGQQTTAECRVTSAYIYSRIQLSGPAMAASKNAFAEALSYEMEGATKDLIFDLGRQTYGEGLGILAAVSTDSCATAISVMNQYGEPGNPGARYVQTGQLIEVGTIAAPNTTSGDSGATVVGTVIASNSGTTSDTITISASMDLVSASTNFIFNDNAGGLGVEMKGLRAIVDDSTASHCYGYSGGMLSTVTLQNVSAESESKWRANVHGNSQTERLIDSALMQRAFDSVKRSSGKMPDKIIGEYDVVSAFLDSVSNDRRFNSNAFDAGRSKLSFNGLELIQDLLAPYNELFLLNKEAIKWGTLKPAGFDDRSGAILKNISGFDLHEAFISVYSQIFAEHRNALAVIRDIRTSL